jgi:acetolactate decarboxylase
MRIFAVFAPRYLVGIVLVLATGCVHSPFGDASRRDQVTQASQVNALMLGQYNGGMEVGQLLRYGNFGIGTFDHLDGEMIMLEGKVWQAKSDGSVTEASPRTTTPFAVVTPFEVDGKAVCPAAGSLTALESYLDGLLPNQNLFFAIRIDADFETVTLRSVPRQEPPYKPLAEVTKQQKIWTRSNLSGTLIGVRSPKWVGNLNVPGYHWHFLSNDGKLGGHVFDSRVASGTITYDQCGQWLVKPNESISREADLSKDLSHELEQVEKRRGSEINP